MGNCSLQVCCPVDKHANQQGQIQVSKMETSRSYSYIEHLGQALC